MVSEIFLESSKEFYSRKQFDTPKITDDGNDEGVDGHLHSKQTGEFISNKDEIDAVI